MRVDEFRSRFPITSDRAYLFSGAMAPAADTVISAARVASSAAPGAMTDAIAERTDDDTVAIVVSHVDPLTGIRHDLEALAEVARRHASALMVDVAQSAGVLEIPTHLDEVRIVVGTTMKWLLGTPGIGFLYVHPRLMDRVDGLDVGYLGLDLGPEPFPQSWMPQRRSDAGRFELGLPNMAGLVPSAEGIRLVMGLGQSVVLDRISRLAGYCIEGLRDAGITVRTPIEPRHRAGIVAFDIPSAPELAEYLRSRRVDVGGYHWGLGRVDPHAFNNEEDVERFLAGVQAFQNGRTGT